MGPFQCPKERWLFALLNVALGWLLAQAHFVKAVHFLQWQSFVLFDGPQPFQSRVLPFLIASALNGLHELSDRDLARLFVSMDFLAALVAIHFTLKAASVLRAGVLGSVVAVALVWWQLFATFVVSLVHNYFYPYDLASVAFISVAIWMILGETQPWRIALLCVVAMLNRETAVVVPFFYLMGRWGRREPVLRVFALLLAVCVLVKLSVAMALGAGEGVASIYHEPGFLRFFYNLSFLTLRPRYFHTLNVLFAFGAVWVFLFFGGSVSRTLRRMMWCLVPFLLGMSVVGNLSEIRVLAEFIPLMALMLANKFEAASRMAVRQGEIL